MPASLARRDEKLVRKSHDKRPIPSRHTSATSAASAASVTSSTTNATAWKATSPIRRQ
jgi:hypothetical protein